MKKALLFFSFILFTHFAFSQTTIKKSFTITKNNSPYSSDFITASIEKSNLESYRSKNVRNTIHFENGFDIEFLSAKELFINGTLENINGYNDFAVDLTNKVFSLNENGIVLIGIKNHVHPKSIK